MDETRRTELPVAHNSAEQSKQAQARRRKWSGNLVSLAIVLLSIGILDRVNAQVLCVDSPGITILRMVMMTAASAMVLGAVAVMIPSKRWRTYWGILAFFIWMYAVNQPYYYFSLRNPVDGLSCVWTGKKVHPRAFTA